MFSITAVTANISYFAGLDKGCFGANKEEIPNAGHFPSEQATDSRSAPHLDPS